LHFWVIGDVFEVDEAARSQLARRGVVCRSLLTPVVALPLRAQTETGTVSTLDNLSNVPLFGYVRNQFELGVTRDF
jgi:hypothetical protein